MSARVGLKCRVLPVSTPMMGASVTAAHVVCSALNLPAAEYEAAGLAEVAAAPAEAVIEALRREAAAATERPTKCAQPSAQGETLGHDRGAQEAAAVTERLTMCS